MNVSRQGEDPRVRLDALLEQALVLEGHQRARFIDEVTAQDPALRARLEALLAQAARASPLLDLPHAASDAWRALFHPGAERPPGPAEAVPEAEPEQGRRIGAWRIVRLLGRGGMGTVHLAERVAGGFEQVGALKLIRGGVDSDEFLRRFEQERQILATLNHPGIARLLDGGRDADERPYLVMEYVDGRPLDDYCDANRLTVEQRINLFAAIGRAVAHAHRHLVVHRDLKPSNILVTHDGNPKLLDFGIAKVLATDPTHLRATRTVLQMLTPEYATPEQVRNQPITTATDVYQLGLLLYETLLGQRAQRGAGVTSASLEHVVCEQEPPRASMQAAQATPEACAARRTTHVGLRRKLRGDLDVIVDNALRKAPERRYASAAELADDLERWQRGRPIHARRESMRYRAIRFVQRHPFGVGGAAAALVLLLAYAATVTLQAENIARERDRAQAEATKARQVQDLVLRLLAGADPERSGGVDLSARELLERGWDEIREELKEQPQLRAELLDTMGEAYRQLGLYERSQPLFDEALLIARKRAAAEPVRLAQALRSRGRLYDDMGQLEPAIALLREALDRYRAVLAAPHAEIANTLSDLGFALTRSTDYIAAEQTHRAALAMRRDLFGEEHSDVADSLVKLGMALRNQGNYAAAEPLLAEALAMRRRLLPPTHPHLAHTLSDLAMLRADLGQVQSAEALYRESLALTARVHGPQHPYVATVMNNLARMLQRQQRHAEARDLLEQALAIRRRALGEHNQSVGMNLNDLGQVLAETGDLDGAQAYYEQAQAAYPPGHPWRAATTLNLGRLAQARGKLREAERLYRLALVGQEQHYGTNHDRVANVLVALGGVLHKQGRTSEAEPLLRRALAIYRQRLPEQNPRLAEAQVPLAAVLVQSGRRKEARVLLREALDIRRAAFGTDDALTREAGNMLAASASTTRR